METVLSEGRGPRTGGGGFLWGCLLTGFCLPKPIFFPGASPWGNFFGGPGFRTKGATVRGRAIPELSGGGGGPPAGKTPIGGQTVSKTKGPHKPTTPPAVWNAWFFRNNP